MKAINSFQSGYILNTVFFLLLFTFSALVIAGEENAATIIKFSEYEDGVGHYPVRMTITENFLRIDDTSEGKDFVLFQRKENVIYSVNSEDQQIIKIKLKPVTIKSPMELKLHSRKMATDEKAPLISGRQTEHYQFFVNDKRCYDLVTAPGLMSDAVIALKKFKQVLAGQQAETLRFLPADVHEACDLVKHTFYPQLYLEKGFPVMEQSMVQNGETKTIKYSRTLVDFMKKKIVAEIFVLPDYEIVEINYSE